MVKAAPNRDADLRHRGDEWLIHEYLRTGDSRLFEALYRKHYPAAFRTAYCITGSTVLAEEALQDAVVKLLTARARFVSRGAGSFRPWFLGAVANSARLTLRTERRARKGSRIDQADYACCTRAQEPLDPSEHPCRKELRTAVAGLRTVLRKPIEAYYFFGRKQQELAQELGISQQCVSNRISAGLNALRSSLA